MNDKVVKSRGRKEGGEMQERKERWEKERGDI